MRCSPACHRFLSYCGHNPVHEVPCSELRWKYKLTDKISKLDQNNLPTLKLKTLNSNRLTPPILPWLLVSEFALWIVNYNSWDKMRRSHQICHHVRQNILNLKSKEGNNISRCMQVFFFFKILHYININNYIWKSLFLIVPYITNNVNYFTCIPGIVASGPGQLRFEWEHQVEKAPDLENDVGELIKFHNQLSVFNS